MAGTPPKKLGPFNLGVNTRLSDTELRNQDGYFLRSGVNVDLTAGGKVRRRRGTTNVQTGTACHSFWSDGTTAYYADGATLYRVRTGPNNTFSRDVVRADLIVGLRVSYVAVGDQIYYSNGVNFGMVSASTSASDWGPLPPLDDPTLASYMFRPLPTGTIVRWYKGRLLSVQGAALFYSEPFALNVYNPARGYIPFDAAINIVATTDDGIYVCTSNSAFWLAGDLVDAQVDQKLPYGAIPGSDSAIPNSNSVMWTSPRGLVRGDTDGTVENLQEKNVTVADGRVGATLFRELDGMKKAVSSVFNVTPSLAGASSYMSAEVVRKGITL